MWLFFTLATTLLWGVAELFYKKGSHEERKYDHLRVCILVGAVMGIHAVFTLLTSDVAYNPMNLIAYLPVSLCYILSMACSYFGIRFIEESLSDPIENTAGKTDLLVTWLYKLTIDRQYYNLERLWKQY